MLFKALWDLVCRDLHDGSKHNRGKVSLKLQQQGVKSDCDAQHDNRGAGVLLTK
jgi:hypothetical protein